MRRSHRAVVAEALAHGEWGWLVRAAGRTLAARLGLPVGPLFATLAVTFRCNYRCTFCDLPDRARGDPPLAALVARLDRVVADGARAVGLTGGEPLLHPQLFEVIAAARARGLLVHLNSNGSRLTEAAVAPLLASGLHSLHLSLDGAIAATHDELRQVPGSFVQIEATLAALRAGRAARGARRPRLGLVMAVTPRNWREVADFARLAVRWQVDAAGFLPHHEFVETRARLSEPDAAELARRLREAQRIAGARLDNSAAYLAAVPRFLAGATTPLACSAPRTHVAVAPDGRRYPCVPLMTLERGGRDADAPGPPAPPGPTEREEICRACWWNCHRELDLTLKTIAAPR
ncbi:MAG: radical SAM protein [Planctomycetes bacterium]|nr:radical SAM protein [Planctomycetota bacterium]